MPPKQTRIKRLKKTIVLIVAAIVCYQIIGYLRLAWYRAHPIICHTYPDWNSPDGKYIIERCTLRYEGGHSQIYYPPSLDRIRIYDAKTHEILYEDTFMDFSQQDLDPSWYNCKHWLDPIPSDDCAKVLWRTPPSESNAFEITLPTSAWVRFKARLP